MRHKSLFPYLLLICALLALISLSKEKGEYIKGNATSLLEKPWEAATQLKISSDIFFQRLFSTSHASIDATAQLQIQTLLLKNQKLEAELKKIQALLGEDLAEFFDFDFQCLPATVVYRSYSNWNSAFWINVGSEDNQKAGAEIITKNSPVILGTSVIGVVDQIEKNQSRIRLITDSGLRPSVRVKRTLSDQTYLLAKGELFGSSQPLWKREGLILHGIGFNYDFADSEGPARDLRTGQLVQDRSNKTTVPLVKIGDTLVTTGLDGIFPPGLDVAIVTRVIPLQEGDYYYELEAKPTAENINNLSYVFVIPPLTAKNDYF